MIFPLLEKNLTSVFNYTQLQSFLEMNFPTIIGDVAILFNIVNISTGFTCIWLEYGVRKGDDIVRNVNIIGVLMYSFYVLFYYFWTTPKAPMTFQIFMILCAISGFHLFLNAHARDGFDVVNLCGWIGSGAALCFFASPLAQLGHVIRSGSVESLPLPLILSSFVVSSLWSLYGYLVNDLFILGPNGCATAITGCQLVLFCFLPRRAVAVERTDSRDRLLASVA